ncbi:MAG: DUF421 domain-containing protein [Bacillales bacterium]|nr:DUF421 domain-containing protein [Bacillales bacterium]
MGKREIGELSILDLVVFIMMGEMAVIAIEKPNTPIMHTLFPMLIIMGIQILSAYISLKSPFFRRMMDGKPAVIINKGKIDESVMKKNRYNFDDLMVQLREKDVRNIDDVEFAILEPSGSLSVLKKENNKKEDNSFTLPLILDGEIQEENLEMIHKSPDWLKNKLRERGFRCIKEISFCSYQGGKFYIDKKHTPLKNDEDSQ